jgi:amino acid adenylation domain-containing protein
MVAAMLAVLKAGGAYVGLDPAYPLERLAFMLADAGVAVLLAEAELASALPEHTVPTLGLDDDSFFSGESVEAAKRLPKTAEPGNLAYLVYTSGSTGRPKGVAIEHASAVALVDWAREVFPATALAGVLASTSICFDLSVFEIFVPLALGGRVILAENALALPTLPAAGEVTLLNTVPSVLAGLLHSGDLPPMVATVNLAGEALPRERVEEAYRQPGVTRVLNLYGPSEDTTYSTWAAVPAGESGPPPIGRPIAGTRARLLDSRLDPVPIGVPGELCLAGAGLARGYLGRPERTAERFVPDPFTAGRGGERLYRTGDLARLRPDGEILYLGRLDRQVKIRGFRIEPGEIEAALAAHPAVREAAVVARRDGGDVGPEPRLVAYVVTAGTSTPISPAIEELRAFLSARLPAHMVPAAFVTLDALPLTPNGKLDRAALPAPERLGQPAESWVAPASPLEELLAKTTEELLGVPQVGMRDNFFALGGHSLLATQLVSRLTRDYGIEVTVQMVFDAPDFGALADRIVERELSGAGDDLLAEALAELAGTEGL